MALNALFIVFLLIYIQLLPWDLPKIFHFAISPPKNQSDGVSGCTAGWSGAQSSAPLWLMEKLSLTVVKLNFLPKICI